MGTPKTFACVALAIVIVAATAAALDLSRFGLTIVHTVQAQGKYVLRLRDGARREFTVQHSGELDDAALARIVALKDQFFSFRTMKVDAMTVTLDGKTVELHIIPSSLTYAGADMVPFLPAGMYFTQTDFLEYDLRIVKDRVSVRVRGVFSTEEDLLKKMAAAIANPMAYLQRSDPEYYYGKIDELERQLRFVTAYREASQKESLAFAEALASIRETLASIQERLGSIQNTLSSIDSVLAVHRDSLVSVAERLAAVEERLAALSESQEELAGKHEKLASEVAAQVRSFQEASGALRGELEALRAAVMTSQNVVWWFWRKPIPKEGIERLLAIKRAAPELTAAKAAADVRAEGIELSDQEAVIIFAVYLNEF